MNIKNIRNFCIIAHIDHGKSTLSDRLIEKCGLFHKRKMIPNQVLDSMDLEKERGITIKAQSVTLHYFSENKKKYQFNFIDTPGHVDFSYEVSRSLSACEGALLVIDAKKGVQAQTKANCLLAMKMNLNIIPILNKIDLLGIDFISLYQQIKKIIGIKLKPIHCSAKIGIGIKEILESLIKYIPYPKGNSNAPLQALIIDSWFDKYLGIIFLVCIKNGTLQKKDKIKIMSTGKIYSVEQLGIFIPHRISSDVLYSGQVGWVVCSIKDILGAPVGDTITLNSNPALTSLPNFKKIKPKPQVFASLFPIDTNHYNMFQNALKKLSLNDSSIFYEKDSSRIFGYGFRCGFLGLLHMEIIQERLEREYNLELITTAPNVIYEIKTKKNKIIYIDNISNFPFPKDILELREPIAECNILAPKKFLGNIIKLCIEKRGIHINTSYYEDQISMIWQIPMIEIIFDFFDRLKSISSGYASLNYSFKKFQVSDLVKLDIIINNQRIDEMSSIMHRHNTIYRSRILIEKVKTLIQKQQFEIIIQAAINNKIIARTSIKPFRKNVISKCYGGDITRKKKLLKKQKEGKKRMKNIGNLKLSQEVFLSLLKIGKN